MEGITIVDQGLEKLAKIEIEEKLKVKAKTSKTVVIFETKKEEDICKLTYSSQLIQGAGLLLGQLNITQYEEENEILFEELFNKLNLSRLKENLKITCERHGEHEFNSVDVTRTISKILHEKGFKPDLKNKDQILHIHIQDEKAYVYIDYAGRDLSKRNYRIFVKAATLKGTLGYSLLKFGEYKVGENLIDPYCESGIIPIEAALMATKKPVNFYQKDLLFGKFVPNATKIMEAEDNLEVKKIKGIYSYDKTLKNIASSKKNAKIAGVEKEINFSKTELEWLDTKFEEKSVDKIITKLPSESKKVDSKDAQKIYEEFFYQAAFILKDKGLVVVCSQKNEQLKEYAKKKNFEIKKEISIFSGQQEYKVTIFKKSSAKSI